MKTAIAVEKKSSHILLSHLPPAPSSILVLGCSATFKTGDLTSLGYEITVTGMGKSCGDGIDSEKNGGQTPDADCFFDSNDQRYQQNPMM